MSLKVFGFADVGRAGLGNMLLPWARCEVFCAQRGCSMLAPRWIQPKVGPLLRGERDKRYYMGLFDNSSYVRGLKKWIALASTRKVPEEQADRLLAEAAGSATVVFRGLGRFYDGLSPHRELLHRRLLEILSLRTRQLLAGRGDDLFVAAHVRRGDMAVLRPDEPFHRTCTRALPIEWFVNCVHGIRRAVGRAVPVRVFSDGHSEQLGPLLSLGGVALEPPGPSIVDILLLSKAKVLITTGSSTFSAWAAFLGRMPSLWYPGSRWNLHPDRPVAECETDPAGRFPDVFADVLRATV